CGPSGVCSTSGSASTCSNHATCSSVVPVNTSARGASAVAAAIACAVPSSPASSAFVTSNASLYATCAPTAALTFNAVVKWVASTSATTIANRTALATGSRRTAHAIGRGSATPVVSSTIASIPGFVATSSSNVRSRSSPSTQHTQPPGSSTCRAPPSSSAPSMPTSPSSLTITPSLPPAPRSARRASKRFTSVVLPAPRNPVTSTSGQRTRQPYRQIQRRAHLSAQA